LRRPPGRSGLGRTGLGGTGCGPGVTAGPHTLPSAA
jgi:hypothetical protein